MVRPLSDGAPRPRAAQAPRLRLLGYVLAMSANGAPRANVAPLRPTLLSSQAEPVESPRG